MATATGAKAGETKSPFGDFEAMTSFFTSQTAASIKQGEEILAVARKQLLSNIHQTEALAIEALDKVKEFAADALPTLPAMPTWLPEFDVKSSITAGFEVAEQMLAAERKIAASVIEFVAAAGK